MPQNMLPSEFDPESPSYFRSPLLKDPAPSLTFLSSLLEGGGGNPALLNAINAIRGGLQQRQTRTLADAARVGYFSGQSPAEAGQQKVIEGRSGFGKLFESLGVVGPSTEQRTMNPDEQYAAQMGADLAQKRAATQLMNLMKFSHMMNADELRRQHEEDIQSRWEQGQKSAERRHQESEGRMWANMDRLQKNFLMSFKRQEQEDSLKYDANRIAIERLYESIRQHNQTVDETHLQHATKALHDIASSFTENIKELQKQAGTILNPKDPARVEIEGKIKNIQEQRSVIMKSMGSIYGLKIPDKVIKDYESEDKKTEGGLPAEPDPSLFEGGGEAPPKEGYNLPGLPRPSPPTPRPERSWGDFTVAPSPIPESPY